MYRLNTTVAFGKATGFGDIVGACIEPPIEIGNRVWNDTNKNGLQDAGEQGLPDVRLVLYNNVCTAIGTAVTDEKEIISLIKIMFWLIFNQERLTT